MPEESQVNNVWEQQALTERVTLPSGQTVIAQRIGIEEILSTGSGDQMDTLTSYVLSNHIDRVRGPQDRKPKQSEQEQTVTEAEVERIITERPEMISSTLSMFDSLLPAIVVKPPVRPHTRKNEQGEVESIPADERTPGAVYTDRIGLEDKVFLFQWAVGGLPNPDFREQSGQPVGAMENGNDVSLPAVNAAGGPNRAARRRNRKR